MTDASAPAIVHDEQVNVRRSVKFGSFMTVGAGLGVVTGVVLAVSQPATGGESLQQIIGFLALVFGVAGVASGALIAVILDRTLGRRARAVTAKRTEVAASE